MTSQLEKMIEKILIKVYNQGKLKNLNKHSKKIQQIRAKKKYQKRQGLHFQFKYANQLLQNSQKRLGIRPTNIYNQNHQNTLRRMRRPRMYQMWEDTRMPNRNALDPKTYVDFRNIYRNLIELDWISRQQQQYNNYNNGNT